MELLYILLILLFITRTPGEIAARLGKPALVDELLSETLLGVVVHQFSGALPIFAALPLDRRAVIGERRHFSWKDWGWRTAAD